MENGSNRERAHFWLFFSIIIFVLLSQVCSKKVSAQNQQSIKFEPTPINVLEAIYNGRATLEQADIRHSDTTAKYKEKRRMPSGAVYEFEVTDYEWKEIALQLMNLETGQTAHIKALKVLDELVYLGNDFKLELESRPSGELWNTYNTAYIVTAPPNWVIINNKYKRYNRNPVNAKEVIYAPYSQALHRTEFVDAGKEHLREDIETAIQRIHQLKPSGINLPIFTKGNDWVTGMMERIALIEQSDPYEVIEYDKGLDFNPFERVYVTIFLNQDEAFGSTVSSANASGLMQWTKRTWDNVVRKTYPWAMLPDFETGSVDHIHSITASILLHNYNLQLLQNEFKTDIFSWREPEQYLAACYNGGPGHVTRAIRWALGANAGPGRWRMRLRRLQRTSETYYFLEKLDIAIKHGYGS